MEKYPLNSTKSPIDYNERLLLVENWTRITSYFNHLQSQLNVLAGKDVGEMLTNIENVMTDAQDVTNIANKDIELINEELNKIMDIIVAAETALDQVNIAATNATDAAEAANTAKQNTDAAIVNANDAAEAANEATEKTETAMQEAIRMMQAVLGSFQFLGAWSSTTPYVKNNLVTVDGSVYIALLDNIDIPVTNSDTWRLFAQKGDTGEQGPAGAAPDTSNFVLIDGSRALKNMTVGTRASDSTVGTNSLAQGSNVAASGSNSHAEGYQTTASGGMSHAEGRETTASGQNSHAEGYLTTASGNNSHAEGYQTTANSVCLHAMGRYNKEVNSNPSNYSATNDVFVIGNGSSSSSLGNAFRVAFDGSIYGQSAFNSSGADYAEYFEWVDGNEFVEDRVGYVVTLEEDKIRKAEETDAYIVGIVSANPSVIGDSYQDDWQGKYVTDEWGRVEYERIEVVSEEGIQEETHMKIHPDWVNEETYIPRSQRPEWDAVGLIGKLFVRDDGTCEVNGYAKVGAIDGVLTYAEEPTNMRIMERINDHIVKVLIK